MRRAVVGCLVVLGALWVLGGSARAVTVGAGSASLVVLGRSGPLVKDASGSYYTTDVKLVLITPPPTKGAADTIAIWVTGGASRACRIGLSTDQITPRVPTTVTFTLLPSCLTSSSQGGGSITVHAGAAGAPVAAAVDVALGAVQPEPVQGQAHWWYLWLMAATVVGGSLLVLGATLYARRVHKTAMPKHWLRAPLEGLDTGWSFKDSWAANLTFLGTFATGIFAASDVLKAVLGSSPDQALAVMTVAGVIAAGMAGAGALLTSTFTNQGSPVTVAVLGAAAITLGGASGQLLVIGLEASTFNLGAWAWILMAPAMLLIGVYGVVTVFRLLTEHDVPPAPGAASDTVLAGVLLATVMTDPPDARSWPDPREVRTRADELAHASDLPTRVARIRAIHRSKPDDVRIAGLVMNNELDLSDPDALATVPVDPTRRPTRRRAAML